MAAGSTGTRVGWFTKLFIWVVGAIIIGFDVYWATNVLRGDTISEITKAYSWRWATIPVLYGVLTGHLFWSKVGEITYKWQRIIALWLLVVLVGVLDAVDLYDMMPVFPLVPSILLGRLLWPQSVSVKQALFTWKA